MLLALLGCEKVWPELLKLPSGYEALSCTVELRCVKMQIISGSRCKGHIAKDLGGISWVEKLRLSQGAL